MNLIKFTPSDSNSEFVIKNVPHPIKASSVFPEWFRGMDKYHNKDKAMKVDGNYHNLTVKNCMPFLDSMIGGYLFTTWCDIHVVQKDGKPIIFYDNNELVSEYGFGVLNYQPHFISNVVTQNGYDDFNYAWATYWRVETPAGISCLFTHPLNRPELPFISLSGVVETDKWHGSDVINTALEKGFEGTIPKGTPYLQVIPFRREEWESLVVLGPDGSQAALRNAVLKERYALKPGYYRDHLWEKKKFK